MPDTPPTSAATEGEMMDDSAAFVMVEANDLRTVLDHVDDAWADEPEAVTVRRRLEAALTDPRPSKVREGALRTPRAVSLACPVENCAWSVSTGNPSGDETVLPELHRLLAAELVEHLVQDHGAADV